MPDTISLSDLHKELKNIEANMVTKQEMNRFIESVAVLSSSKTMNQIRKSEKDIVAGRIKGIKSVRDI